MAVPDIRDWVTILKGYYCLTGDQEVAGSTPAEVSNILS